MSFTIDPMLCYGEYKIASKRGNITLVTYGGIYAGPYNHGVINAYGTMSMINIKSVDITLNRNCEISIKESK